MNIGIGMEMEEICTYSLVVLNLCCESSLLLSAPGIESY